MSPRCFSSISPALFLDLLETYRGRESTRVRVCTRNTYVNVGVRSCACSCVCVCVRSVHERAPECVWIITCLQGRLPVDPQIQALSHPKWPPRESDERAVEGGGTGGRVGGRAAERERWDLTKDKQRTRERENERGWRLIELAQSTSRALYLLMKAF